MHSNDNLLMHACQHISQISLDVDIYLEAAWELA